jgi:hypothetical protein
LCAKAAHGGRHKNKEETMTSLLHTTIRRSGLVLVATVAGAILAGSALAGNGSGLNLPPQAAIKASSANWAAKAKLLDINGQLRVDRFAPTAATQAASANWAARAKLLDVNGRLLPQTTVSTQVSSSGFDWSDFGIGAGAMLGAQSGYMSNVPAGGPPQLLTRIETGPSLSFTFPMAFSMSDATERLQATASWAPISAATLSSSS